MTMKFPSSEMQRSMWAIDSGEQIFKNSMKQRPFSCNGISISDINES